MGSRARPYMPRARPLLPRPRLRQYAARTTLCDARVTHDPAFATPGVRTPSTAARPFFRARDLSGAGDFAPRNPTYPTYPT